MVIGVGEMSEISAKHLVASGADVYIMNRTKRKAEILAQECNAKVIEYGKLGEVVNEFEIIFTSTGSREAIINDEIIEPCDFDRYWFDMALPRDIDYHKGDRINLYQIDDLKNIVNENMGHRKDSARAAQSIIGRAIVEFFEWLNTLDIEPMIKEIYEKAYLAATAESSRAINNGYIPKEYEAQTKKVCEQALKRFLHEMTQKMRCASQQSSSDSISGALQFLMDDKNGNVPEKYKCEHMLKGKK